MKDKRKACKRCGIEFEDANPPVECGECDEPTLCLACAEDHACCAPNAVIARHEVGALCGPVAEFLKARET